MKKIISIISILLILLFTVFSIKSYAAPLGGIDIQTDKTTVRPGEEVKVMIEFGQDLGAYTFDIAYDNNIFEYVSAEGGTANDTSTKVRVTFYDSTGGTSPRTNMSVTFRAKADITTSNPTEFSVTAEGLANADASVSYDDITIPIVKNVTVEPEYIDYTLKLEHTGEIIKGEAKEMTLSYSSPMGKYYEHARLIAEATTPGTGNVTLIGKDQAQLDHDIIQSGWGDAQGYKIGGKDVSQVLNVNATFSEAGDYSITLKLIDRDNSDNVIAEETFQFTVLETATTPTPPENTNPGENEETTVPLPEETPTTPEVEMTPENEEEEQLPAQLPKTGINTYLPIAFMIILLVISIWYFNKKEKNKQK